ncbi:MAG TPA: anthranilate phosphoribosyltransferase [Caulobacteraceae bacterium]
MAQNFKALLALLADGATLGEEDADIFFSACLQGEPTPAQVAAAVTAMRLRGETLGEITACARAMRREAVTLDHPYDVIDVCGTGGDGARTLNISTAVALVAAAGGLKVAKHGNRAVSSSSGSSDVLEALGVNIAAGLGAQRRALDEAGICFLFAPAHHGAMRHVMPVREDLGFRTIFNLLGPLSNPAGASRQLLGVFESKWVEPLARALGALGTKRAWVVHGDGLDEITTTGPTQIAEWRDGGVRLFTVTPEAVGLPRAVRSDLVGGEPAVNAAALRSLLEGATGPYRDIVLLNAAAAFLVAEQVETLREGLALGVEVLDSGAATRTLERLVEITSGG